MSDTIEHPAAKQFWDAWKHANETNDGPPRSTWMGHNVTKCPLDLFVYQEIIFSLRPAVIVEGGTCAGGTALFFAHMLELSNTFGQVWTIDWDASSSRPQHYLINQIIGNTLDPAVWERLSNEFSIFENSRPRLFILDDGHSQEHVAAELELCMPLLRGGDYLIVEDTDLGGPWWGLDAWINKHPERALERDRWAERHLMTQNPKGYWKVLR